MLQALDRQAFYLINGLAGRWAWLDGLARLVVNDYLMPSAIVLMLVWLWFSGRDAEERSLSTGTVVNAVAAQFVANMILKLINLAYFRPRPFDTLEGVNLVFYRPWDSSCPSNPITFAFAIAVSVYLGRRKPGMLALGLGLTWGLSRVYSGVNYPLDVVAGALLGGTVAYWLGRRSGTMDWIREHLLALVRRGMVA